MSVEISGVRPTRIDNVFTLQAGQEEWLATLSTYPEGALQHEGRFFRPWSPATSKLSSMILKGMQIPSMHSLACYTSGRPAAPP